MDMLSQGTNAEEQFMLNRTLRRHLYCTANDWNRRENILIYSMTKHCLQGLERYGVWHLVDWEEICLWFPSEALEVDGNCPGVHCSSWYCEGQILKHLTGWCLSLFGCVALIPLYCVCCRGCGEQWTSGKISPWAGNQILCQGEMFMLTYFGHTLKAVFTVLLTVSSFQILMPLINQYFKNHCLYFLSTPAKVLGSGGHSSNKEKEMIARWALQLRRYNWQLWHMFSILLLHLFLTICPHFLVLYFSFLSTIVSFVKCLLWWDTEFLSLVRY